MLTALLVAVLLQVDAGQLCGDQGALFACDDPSRERICWDSREQQLAWCASLPQDKDGTLRRTSEILGGQLLDILSTGSVIHWRGGREANPLLPTPEIRLGAKGLAALAQIAVVEFVARALHRPRIANWMAHVSLGTFTAVAVGNASGAW